MASSSSATPATNSPMSSPLFLLSNICNLVPLRLDFTNYVLWKYQVSSILKAHSLFGHIDDSLPCPPKLVRSSTGTETTEVSSDYLQWISRDQALLTLINATLSPSALAHVVGSATAKDLWSSLEKRYSSKTRSNILDLRSALYTIKKSSSETIDQYTCRIKDLVDKLAAASVTIEEEEILVHTLNGLPDDFSAFRTSIRTRSGSLSLEELHALLVAEEKTTKNSQKTEILPTAMAAFQQTSTTAFKPSSFTPHSNRGRGRRQQGRGRAAHSNYVLEPQHNSPNFQSVVHGSGPQYLHSYGPNIRHYHGQNSHAVGYNNARGILGSSFNSNPSIGSGQNFGSGQNNGGRISCQICSKFGHSALDCYNRMNFSYQGRHPPAQLAAMAVNSMNPENSSDNSNNFWLSDSGCNVHMTNDLANLNLSNNYNGEESVTVGNGQSLNVQHTGSG